MPLNYREGAHFVINRETSKEPGYLANYADRDALFHYWHQKPFQDVTNTLRKTQLGYNPELMETPFVDWLEGGGRSITVREKKIRYRKQGKGTVHFRILRSVSGDHPGLNRQLYPIVLNTDVFKPGDKIGPEESLLLQVVVQSPPKPTGDGFEYLVQNLDGDKDAFFPPEYLVEGTRFKKTGSSNYSEASEDWGSTMFMTGHSVLTWEVGLFKTGKELTITDEALNHIFTLDACDENEELIEDMPRTFVSAAEANMLAEVKSEMELDLLFSTYNHSIADTSNRLERQIGAGVFDFLRDGNIWDYSPENSGIREFVDFLISVWYNDPGQTIVFGTGLPGLDLADTWIKREFGEVAVIRKAEDYLTPTSNSVPAGTQTFQFRQPMFNEYRINNLGTVRFEYWAFLDDRYNRGPKHPKNGKPLLGYHFIGARYRGEGIESNIVKVNRENSTIWAYRNGVVGPYAPLDDRKSGRYVATHPGRYTTLHHGDSYGLFVEDVNDFVWFRPNVRNGF